MYLNIFGTILVMALSVNARYVLYLTGQHPIIPSPDLVSQITHVALAFMPSSLFNSPSPPAAFPLFTTVKEVRAKFAEGTKIMVAIGGWGDTEGFETAAKIEEGMELWCENVKTMVEMTGADGVDIDWEYPGGNGEDYKTNPNPTKSWQIQSYPILLSTLRNKLGPNTLISAAVPGLPQDMLAFTPTTLPSIVNSLDFINLMTYDLMNRRSNITSHHTGITASLLAIDTYVEAGVPASKLNLGFAFYVKWFKTPLYSGECSLNPIGCKTEVMEDPITGGDLGLCGGFSYHDSVNEEVEALWEKAKEGGGYDEVDGGHYFWDREEGVWWSWDTVEAIEKKFELVVQSTGLGGVFAWGLGEDAVEWKHLEALNEGVRGWKEGGGRGGVRRCRDTEGLEEFYRDTVERTEL